MASPAAAGAARLPPRGRRRPPHTRALGRAVVVGVVPRQPALVAALLPEGLHELHRLHRYLGIEDHLLAGLVSLGRPEGPRQRIGEHRRVAEGVSEGLPVGLALLLEPGKELARGVPGLRVLAGPGLLEPRPAV